MTGKIAVHDHDRRDAVKWIDPPEGKLPGEIPERRIGVFTRRGERVGHVSHGARASVARRLLGGSRGAVLSQLHGAPAWIERNDPVAVAAKGRRHAADLRAAKGSVGSPRAPKAHARPHR